MKINCVLLIDDDTICNYLHEKMIRRLNICKEIKIASNGSEALKIIQTHCLENLSPPELILLDLKMPVMDGFDFLQKFKEKFPKHLSKTLIKIITTSAHPSDIQKISNLYPSDIYTKPLTEDILQRIYTDWQQSFSKKKNQSSSRTLASKGHITL